MLSATSPRGRRALVAALAGPALLLGCSPRPDAVVGLVSSGSAPVVVASGWSAESNQSGSGFGFALDTAGDVNGDSFADIIVGAYGRDNGESDEGGAYVYHGSATGPGAAAAWVKIGVQRDAQYGRSVAGAGDVNGDGLGDVVVGAWGYDNGQNEEGRIFVYHGSATGLRTTAAWTAESDLLVASLGISVSTAGDVNGDAYADIIAGANWYDNGQVKEGAAYVYHGSSTGVVAGGPAWRTESNQSDAYYGQSVASAGDVNADGYGDVIVGAYWNDNGETNEGCARVFHGSSTGLAAAPSWTGEANQADAQYGRSVAGAGDVNGDGFADVVVGAWAYDNGQASEGRVFVYHGSAAGIVSAVAATVESNVVDASLGIYVGRAGDVNADGFADVVAGANWYNNGQAEEGAVFLYHGAPAGLVLTPAWVYESNQAGAYLGQSVTGAGDVNGDGFADIIAGGHTFDNELADEGRVLLFHGGAAPPAAAASWSAEGNLAGARLGLSLAGAGDVNGDAIGDVVVGAESYGAGELGRAYVYHGGAAGLGAGAAWTSQGAQAGARLGHAVTAAGDVNADGFADVVVTQPYLDNGATDEGGVLLYHGTSTGLTAAHAWRDEGEQGGARLGEAAGGAGDVNGDAFADVIVGAPFHGNGQASEGRAVVYLGTSTGLAAMMLWSFEADQPGASLGAAVATAGDVDGDGFADVITGAALYDNGQTDEGRAYVHHGAATGLAVAAAWTTESNQADARLGGAVAAAGDVNGDGFGDVLVGVPFFDNGQIDEGRAYLYHGSATGLVATAAWSAESDQGGCRFGAAVSSAGDVNADGFADVIIGAPGFDNGQTDEGRALIYYGSATGLASVAAWTVESGQVSAGLGVAVGSAGDVNGDGFADAIAGADLYDNPEADEGRVIVYYGNAGVAQTATFASQRDAAGARFLSPGEWTAESASLRLLARSSVGRSRAKLQWELKPTGQGFNAVGLSAGVPFQSTTTGITTYGTSVAPAEDTYRWRVRLLYDPAVGSPGTELEFAL